MISLKECLKRMNATTPDGAPVPFEISFVTKAGKLITIKHAVQSRDAHFSPLSDKEFNSSTVPQRAPAHFKNRTRNILIPSSGEIRKVNIYKITHLNGEKVIL